MEIIKTPISDLLIIKPKVFTDLRGFFLESYNKKLLSAYGINIEFVQDNHSLSSKNILRGLHYQSSPGQVKLVRVVRGAIWDVAVDLRKNSSTFGKYHALELSQENKLMFFIPIGFAHGFYVLSNEAEVLYKVSSNYNSKTEKGIAWDDKHLNINWPCENPVVSERDKTNSSFQNYRNSI